MRNKSLTAMLGAMLCTGMMMAGCAKTEDVPQVEVREMSMEETKQPEQKTDGEEETEKQGQETDGEEDTEKQGQDTDEEEGAEKPKQDDTETGQEGSGQTVNISQDAEHLGGKVQSPRKDGMILAQTTLVDEQGMVTLLEVKDAKKISVKFTADTRVEHWIIQGGGAGIDMKEAKFSDLEEGQGVELEGYFEGEDFVATKVNIEEYV